MAKTQDLPARLRLRELGFSPGILSPGPLNAITDVVGVKVGHVTRIEGDSTRTGVTSIFPHGGNVFQDRAPAGLFVANGFGKAAGLSQVEELGELETPIVLTNTLSVGRAMEALVDWTLAQPGNEAVRSVNAVVGETNDGELNDIRRRGVLAQDVQEALVQASGGPVLEGNVGAGTGTVAFGWKAGIGTSSRRLPAEFGDHTVGVLVQSNFGGVFAAAGAPVGVALGRYIFKEELEQQERKQTADGGDGSIIIVVATDAPLSDRNLRRLAMRAMAGLARTGAAFSNGSGDYAIAFSTALSVRRRNPSMSMSAVEPEMTMRTEEVVNDYMSVLFLAVIEATEEAILNSLCMAQTMESRRDGHVFRREAIDLEALRALGVKHGLIRP